MKVLVTGATGFVGQALVENLLFETCEVRGLVRQSSMALPLAVEPIFCILLKYLPVAPC